MMDKIKKQAVLFDLDGTILDTIEDLRDSLNHVLEKFSLPARTTDETRRFVGNGLRKLIERAVPEDTPGELIEEMYACLLEYYRSHCRIKTKPYPGIIELLHKLRASGFRTAVISNKADAAVRELTVNMFPGCFDCVLGATDGISLKPDRAMVDKVLLDLKINAKEAVYVGDSQVDIEMAANAQIDCISVTWGFRSREELTESGAGMLADTPAGVFDTIKMICGVESFPVL